ncbi:MAG: tetratricopeptide repeat protein, partial [bacterium]
YELEMKLADIYLQRKENGKVVMVYRNLHEQEKLTLKDKLKLLKYYLWFGRVDDFYKWGMSLPLDKIPLRSLVTLYQVALSRNDYEGAVRLLTQREKSGENPDSILIQRYQMENKFGNIDRSIALAERIYAGNSSEKNFKELVSLYTAEQDYGKLNDLEEKHFLKYPNDAHLAEELYNLYLWNKDLGRGIKYFRSVTKLYPDNPPVSTYLGSLYYLRKEFDKAEIYYSRVEMEEMDDDNLDQLAHVYEMRKKWSKALAALKILYKRSPKPETILNLARVKIELNDFPGALADYKSFLTSHENDFKIRMEYLAVLEDFGERKEVIDQMEKLKRKKMTFFQLRTYAEYAFEMNLYQYARWAYLKILKAHPDSRKAVFRLGLMANWEDNFPEAARYYRLYLSRFPAHPDVLYNLAEIRLTEGKKSLAESLYKKVEKLLLQQQNRNLSQQLLLNKTLIRLGKRLKAIENYQRLFVKYPDKIDVLVDYLELLIDTKSFHEALLVFSKISSLSPGDDLRLLKLRVRLYQDMGNHALAIRILLKAENRYPDKVWIKTSMATNYQMLGRDISSLYYLQTAQWLYPTDNYYLIQDKMDILKTFTDSFSEKVSLLERNNSERRLHLVSTWKTYATDRWFVNASHNREWSRRGKLKGADPAKATSITADIFDLSAHFQQDSYSDYYGGIVNKYGTGGYLGSKFRWKNEQLELRLGYREPWNDFYEIRYRRGEKSTLFSGITGGLPSLSRVLRGESYYNITAFYQEFFLKDQSGSAANKKSRNPFGSARGDSLSLGHNLGNHPIVSVAGNFDWFYASLNNTALVPVATRRAALGTSVNISDQLLSFWGYSIGGGYENNLEMMVNAGYYSLEIYYRPRPNFEFKLGYRKEKSLLTTVYGIVDQYFVNLSVLY